MKKSFLLTAVLCCFFTNLSFAQNLDYGIKGGLSLGKAKLEASADGISMDFENKFRPSVYLGVFLGTDLAPKLKGQVELQYVNSGFKMDESFFSGEVINKIQQLNIPVVLKYEVYKQAMLTGGIYGGFILRVDEEDQDGNKYESTDDYKTLDGGLHVGVEVPLTSKLFVEARYNHGLLDIFGLEIEGGEGTYNNRIIQIGVGYKL